MKNVLTQHSFSAEALGAFRAASAAAIFFPQKRKAVLR